MYKLLKNKNSSSKIVGVSIIALLMAMTAISASVLFAVPGHADPSAQIWTSDVDGNLQTDFSPGDIVYIHGQWFTPMGTISTLTVTRPNGVADSAPGGRFPTALPNIDSTGCFDYMYDLDGIEGTYTIYASDGTHPAQITFTDAQEPLTYNNSAYLSSQRCYLFNGSQPGTTVYAQVSGGSLLPSIFEWVAPNGTIMQTSGHFIAPGPFDDNYVLPADATPGVWTVIRHAYADSTFANIIANYTIQFSVYTGTLLSPIDDSYVQEFAAGSSHNTDDLLVRWTNGNHTRVFIKFDLSTLGLPSNALITSAKLHLYRYGGRTGTDDIGTYVVTNDSWTEDTVTWNNKPPMTDQISNQSVGPINGSYIWDVTSAAYPEMRPGIENKILSIGLNFTNEGNNQRQLFYDRENTASWLRPYLEITYTPDCYIPNQTVEFGTPQNQFYRTTDGINYTIVGPHTPIWINSTDAGIGSKYLTYYINWGENFGSWPHLSVPETTVLDNQVVPGNRFLTDTDPLLGRISVNISEDESCWHEIHYWCHDYFDNGGNSTNFNKTDFIVDATPPSSVVSYEGPHFGDFIGNCTTKVINITDSGCIPGGTGVAYVEWSIWRTFEDGHGELMPNGTGTVFDNYWNVSNPNDPNNDYDPQNDSISLHIQVHENCMHYICHRAYDNMGNPDPDLSNPFPNKQLHYVDVTPPIATHHILGYCNYTDPTGGKLYISSRNEINITINNTGTAPCIYPETMGFWRVYVDAQQRWYPNPVTGADSYDGNSAVSLWKGVYWYNYTKNIHLTEECTHYLEYFAKDPLCNTEFTHNITLYVDNTPPTVLLNVSGHGYYVDPATGYEYLKGGKSFWINASDSGSICQAGVEAIFWRCNYSSTEYPSAPGTGIVQGTELVALYGPEYNIPAITDYYWYRVDAASKEISFDTECRHNVTFFAKDNVCTHNDIVTRTFFVDCITPNIALDVSGHGYYVYDHQYLKGGKNFWINASDSGLCQAGVESIFWRYTYNGDNYPPTTGPATDPVISGNQLVALYGSAYDIPEVTGYDWYRYDGSSKMINFPEQCNHTIYYFAKDNVSHPSYREVKGVIWDNGGSTTDPVVYSSQKDTCVPFVSQFADDFLFSADTNITDVHWYGEFFNGAPDDPVNFNIYIYANDGTTNAPAGSGMPDPSVTALASYHITGVTGLPVDGNGKYSYFANLNPPFVCQGGEKYWIAIQAEFCSPPFWGWATTAGITYGSSMQGFLPNGMPWTDTGVDQAFYLTGNSSGIKSNTFYVDNTTPTTDIQFPTHGYKRINDTSGYLKCYTDFNITADDSGPCQAGIEFLLWRYEYQGNSYPMTYEQYVVINGTTLRDLYGYTDPAFIGHDWYFTSMTTKQLQFSEECNHTLYYWAKDNVCHNNTIKTHTFYVDNTPPTVTLDVSGHGYYVDPASGYQYLKAGKNFWINASDSGLCQAGVESIFWRYNYSGLEYPPTSGPVTDYVVNGTDLVALYGSAYNIPEVTGYDWYQYNGSSKMINFSEQCNHTIYYFAKDNVCHPMFSGVQGIIVWDNGRTTSSSTAYSSQNDTCYPFVSQVADDFQFAQTTEITDVHWYGEFFNGNSFTPVDFNIYIYADDGTGNAPTGSGLPDPASTALASYFFPGVTGLPFDVNGKYSYSVNLNSPFVCQAGQKYWIAIQSVFCFPPQWGWTTTSGITYGSSARGFPILSTPFWTPLGYDMAFYLISSRTFHVDNTSPTTDIQLPTQHGYVRINDTSGYIKCNTNFNITADDTVGQCQAGIEYLLWRYVYNGVEYPTSAGTNVISGADLATRYGYIDPAYISHNWYYTTQPTKQLNFTDECTHTLYYWAKDNVCHNSTMKTHTFYVDNSAPTVEFIPPNHGYYSTGATSGYLKCNTDFNLTATDFPANDCQAGIESIFWRYNYSNSNYPQTPRPVPDPTDSIIYGPDLVTLYGPTYDIPAITGYYWYRYNGSNKIINFTEQCQHELYYFAKDNVCNHSDMYNRTFLVDNTVPTTDIQLPTQHGYVRINDTSGYLKCYTNFNITADDTVGECQAGIEYLLWRYVYNGVEYPTSTGTDVITGAELASRYGYTDPNIITHNWSYTIQPIKQLHFDEECNHTLYYWAKDNVCHNSTMKTHTFYVDNSAPTVTFIPPNHGYYSTGATSGYLKCNTDFNLTATDFPANNCQAGIESIFWRYTYNGDNYPPTTGPATDPVISGNQLVALYGPTYDTTEIRDHDWYRYDGSNKIINFTEQCQHELYYFAKDNVCHHSNMYNQTFLVDNTVPTTNLTLPTTGYCEISAHEGFIKCYTNFTISADDSGQCQAGIEYLLWRYVYNNTEYPLPGEPESITGAQLATRYGYTDPNIIGYNWSYTTQNTQQLNFTQECIHTFYYWAKDNVCHNSTMKTHIFHVDNTPPTINKSISQPKLEAGPDQYGHDVWWVTTDTQICLSANDCPVDPCPCASDKVTFKYRIWFLGNWTDWMEYTGCFNFSEHCTHYLEINTSDCVGNWFLDNETFIVHGEIGEHPTLVSPQCGVILTDNTPTLVWNSVLSQDYYRVEWSTDTFFGTFDYVNITDTQYTLPVLPDGIYYWHVAIIYTSGTIGQWSDTCSFTIDTTNPTAPILDINDPDHDGYDIDGDVTLTWTPAVDTGTGVAYYEGEVSMDPTFMTNISSGHITELFASFNDVPFDGTWYARVHAVDYAENIGPWSNVESIIVDRVLPVVDITSPSMNEFVSGTVTITFTISDLNLDDSTAMISTDNGQTWQVPSGGCIGGVCTHSWDTTVETDGLAYGILAKVSDMAGNIGISEMVIVVVDNSGAETVVIITPLDGSFVNGTVEFEAVASDTVSGIDYVQFWLDGVLYDTDSTPGTWTSSWTTTATNDGVHTLFARAYDNLGNSKDSITISFTVDNTAPTAPALDINDPDHNGYDTDGDVTLTWTPAVDIGTGVAYYEGEVSMDPNFIVGVSHSGNITALFASFNDVPFDGTWYARVHAVDYIGNIGPWSNVESITVDRVLPVVDITSPNMNEFVHGTISITFTINDDNLDSSTALISTDNGQTWQAPSGGYSGGICTHSWNTVTATSGLAYGILAKVSDLAGNTGTSELVIVIVDNNAAETVALIKPLDSSFVKGTVDFEAVASDSVSGISYVEFWLDGVLYATDTTPGTWTSSWATTAVNDSVHTLYARAYDHEGNSRKSVTISFTVDNTAPSAPVFAITDLNGDGYDNDGVVTGNWTAAVENGSGVDYYEVRITDSTRTYSTKVFGDTLFVTLSDVPEGTFSAKVRAADKLGNIDGWSNTKTIIIDTIAPVVHIASPSKNEFVSGTVNITFTIGDVNLDSSSALISTDNGQTWHSPNGVYSSGTWNHTWNTATATNGLAYGILAKVSDLAGNTGTSELVIVIVDNNAAETVALIQPLDGSYVKGVVDFEAVASDSVSGISYVEFWLDGVLNATDTTPGTWTSSWATTASDDGLHTLYARAYDNQGNSRKSVTISFTVDNTAPSAPVFAITDLNGDGYDNDGVVTGNWTAAIENGSGVDYYEVRITDSTRTYSTKVFGDTLFVTLSDVPEGTFSAKVRAADKLGNIDGWSNTKTIKIDTIAPNLVITNPHPDDRLSGSVSITYSATDTNGVAGYQVFIDGGLVYSGTSTSYLWDTTTYNDGSHLIKVTATDAAGNTAEQEVLMQVDNTPGSVSIIYPVDGQEFYAPDPGYYVTVTVTAPDNTDFVDFTGDCIAGTVRVNDPEWEYNWVIGDCGAGDKSITATAFDENGNVIGSDSVTIHIYIDITPPTQVELGHVDDGLGGDEYDADGTITMVWTSASDDDSGIHYYELSICDGSDHERFVTVTEGLEHDYITYTLSDLPDGTYHLKVRAVDYAENKGEWSDTDTVIVDKHAPVITITNPHGGDIVDGTVDITFTGYESANPIVIIDGVEHTSTGSPYAWDTTTTYDGVHSIQVEDTDLAGNIGDSRTVMVSVDNIDESDPHIYITDLEPIEGGRILRVHINAYDDKTSWEDLLNTLRVWIPGGRRDAPTIWSGDAHEEVSAVQLGDTEDYYYADIQIYKYQSGAEITICADVTDEAGNYEPAPPVSYMIQSTIVWDQWMSNGWNKLTLPQNGITGNSSVENVLASIHDLYNAVYWYNSATSSWVSHVYYHGMWLGGLTQLKTGEDYWVQMNNTQARYYTDTGKPELEILDPQNGESRPDGPGDINIHALDYETEITDVQVRIYDATDSLYYGSWQAEEKWHECTPGEGDEWTFGTEGIWTPCHTYEVTARAYDAAGNIQETTSTFHVTCEDAPPVGSGATIDPDTLTITLAPGGSTTEHKTVTLNEIPIGKLDVLFCFDLTGSMSSELSSAQTSSIEIMNDIRAQIPDSSFGVGSFMDYPSYYASCGYSATYGDSYSDYPWNLDQDITSDTSSVSTAINGLSIGSGNDGPESYTRALYESQFASWRLGARKIVIIFEDNVPHDCDFSTFGCYSSGYSTGTDPGRDAIANTDDDLSWVSVVNQLKTAKISVVAVDCGGGWAPCPWQYASDETGGIYALLGSTGTLPDEIVALIGEATATISHLTFEPRAGYEDWFDWTPEEYTDVEGGQTVEFDVTITVPEGTSPGHYHTWLMVMGDGAILAVQEQWITVGEAEPSCIVLTACVDGSDWITIQDGLLSIYHDSRQPIGSTGDCGEWPGYCGYISIDGVYYPIVLPAGEDQYLINGVPCLPVGIQNLDSFEKLDGRGEVSWDEAYPFTIYIDDIEPSNADIYSIQLCGEPVDTEG